MEYHRGLFDAYNLLSGYTRPESTISTAPSAIECRQKKCGREKKIMTKS